MIAEQIPGPAYELILNGQVVVTTSTLTSSIAEWAQFPAVSTIDMTGFGIADCSLINMADQQTVGLFGTISSVGNITGSNTGILQGFITARATNLLGSTATVSSIVNNTISSNFGTITTLSTNAFNANIANISTLSTNTFSANVANFSTTITGPNITTRTITANLLQSYPASSLSISSVNNLNQQAQDISLLADGGAAIASFTDLNLTAQNGNRGRVNITAGGGFNNGVNGEVNIVANAGSVPLTGLGSGGLISLTANSPLVLSSFTSAIKLNAAGINLYAGAIPPIGSLAGYNFIHSDVGTNITTGLPPTLPNIPGTTYLYGTAGVTTSSEFYVPEIYPYWNGLTTPPDLMIAGRYIAVNLATVYVRLSTIRSMEMAGAGAISGVKTFSGTNIQMTNISSINGAVYPPPISFISSFNTLATSSFTVSSINGAAYPPPAGAVSTFSTLTASTFTNNNASISSLSLSSINSMAQFGTKSMIINGDVAQIQLANNAGQFTKMNLLSRQNYSEIQSFDSTFTVPLDLYLTCDNLGVNTKNIIGGYEVDISGSTIIENGILQVATGVSSGTTVTDTFVSTQQIYTSTIQTSTISGLSEINGKDIYTFGEFLTTSTITVTGTNTPTIIPFDTFTVGNQVNLSSGTIQVTQAGLYNLNVNIQLDKSGGGTDTANFWIRQNGADVPNSASLIAVNGTQGETLGICSYYINCNAGDTLELIFASADPTMSATTFPQQIAPPGGVDPYDCPQAPAVISQIKLIR
jgi:hypothetical protein